VLERIEREEGWRWEKGEREKEGWRVELSRKFDL